MKASWIWTHSLWCSARRAGASSSSDPAGQTWRTAGGPTEAQTGATAAREEGTNVSNGIKSKTHERVGLWEPKPQTGRCRWYSHNSRLLLWSVRCYVPADTLALGTRACGKFCCRLFQCTVELHWHWPDTEGKKGQNQTTSSAVIILTEAERKQQVALIQVRGHLLPHHSLYIWFIVYFCSP